MTNEERNEITKLREAGIGYKKIARELGLTRDMVRSFCKRAGLNGVIENEQSDLCSQYKVITTGQPNICTQCGRDIIQKHTGRTRWFCSDKCRHDWWMCHPEALSPDPEAIYKITCVYCGEIFESYGNNKRKYCCHEHYIAARFNKDACCLNNPKLHSEYPVLAIKNLNDSGSVLIDPNKLCNTDLPDDLFLNRIFLICRNLGFHSKFDRFAGQIPHILEMNLINGDAFVFCNRSKSQIGILQWQGDGFALYFKRSDYVRFPWPKNAKAEIVEITYSDLKILLEYPRFLLRLSGEKTPAAII